MAEGGSPQVFRLFGYAGTGKTTLARYFAEHVDGEVLFAAFTGKAAQVLRSKGAVNARTIHSLIYRPRGEEQVADEATGKTSIAPMFSINRQSPVAKAALIIIDECSMVDEALGKDLMSLRHADPGARRSRPVAAGLGWRVFHRPRAGLPADRDPPTGARQSDHPAGDACARGQEIHARRLWQAQVIGRDRSPRNSCWRRTRFWSARNKTRRRYNQRLRELKGFNADFPQSGDKLVCLRNDPAKGLLNGSLWKVMTSSRETVKPGINLMYRRRKTTWTGALPRSSF